MFGEELVVKLLSVAFRAGLRMGQQLTNEGGRIDPDEWEVDIPPTGSYRVDMDNPNVIIRREWIES
jgi:hypothetical protein